MISALPEQIATCERFGSVVVSVASGQKVGIALATLQELPIHALRLAAEGETCGWYIYGGEHSEHPDFYQPLHVSHLNEYCPQIIPYLSLAPGWHVLLAPGYEDVWFDETLLEIAEQ